MPHKWKRILPHGVMLAVAVLLYASAAGITVDTGGRIGPAVWPKTILAIMALLCAYEIGKRLVMTRAGSAKGLVEDLVHAPKAAAGSEPADAAEAPPREYPARLAAGIALVAGYVLAAPWVGFFLATGLFLTAFPWVGGMRRALLSAAIGFGGSLLLVFVFMRVAYISLPLGEGPFRTLSLALIQALGVR